MKRYVIVDKGVALTWRWEVRDTVRDLMVDDFRSRRLARSEVRRLNAVPTEGDLVIWRVADPHIFDRDTNMPCGPYRHPRSRYDLGISPGYADTTPSPCSDGIGYIEDHEICGFVNFEKARRWFPEDEMRGMHKAGLAMHLYRVPADRVRHGRCQVVFDSTSAVLVEVLPLDRLLTEDAPAAT